MMGPVWRCQCLPLKWDVLPASSRDFSPVKSGQGICTSTFSPMPLRLVLERHWTFTSVSKTHPLYPEKKHEEKCMEAQVTKNLSYQFANFSQKSENSLKFSKIRKVKICEYKRLSLFLDFFQNFQVQFGLILRFSGYSEGTNESGVIF